MWSVQALCFQLDCVSGRHMGWWLVSLEDTVVNFKEVFGWSCAPEWLKLYVVWSFNRTRFWACKSSFPHSRSLCIALHFVVGGTYYDNMYRLMSSGMFLSWPCLENWLESFYHALVSPLSHWFCSNVYSGVLSSNRWHEGGGTCEGCMNWLFVTASTGAWCNKQCSRS